MVKVNGEGIRDYNKERILYLIAKILRTMDSIVKDLY